MSILYFSVYVVFFLSTSASIAHPLQPKFSNLPIWGNSLLSPDHCPRPWYINDLCILHSQMSCDECVRGLMMVCGCMGYVGVEALLYYGSLPSLPAGALLLSACGRWSERWAEHPGKDTSGQPSRGRLHMNITRTHLSVRGECAGGRDAGGEVKQRSRDVCCRVLAECGISFSRV